MATWIDVAWTSDAVGNFSLEFTDSGGPSTIALTGSYCHTGLTSVVSPYAEFAAALQAALNADTTLTGAYTVAYTGPSTADFAAGSEGYTISCDESFETANPSGTVAGRVLGRTSAHAAAQTMQSNARPWYVLNVTYGLAQASGDYESGPMGEGGYTLSGKHYTISPRSTTLFADFAIPDESFAATFTAQAVATVPWTWQRFYAHARARMPFALVTSAVPPTRDTALVYQLRPESASFKPRRMIVDSNLYWSFALHCYSKGSAL